MTDYYDGVYDLVFIYFLYIDDFFIFDSYFYESTHVGVVNQFY